MKDFCVSLLMNRSIKLLIISKIFVCNTLDFLVKTHKIYFCIFMVIVCGCGKVPTPEPNQDFGRFNGDFESGNLNGFHFLVIDTSINTQMVTSPVRKGLYSLKNTLRPNDYIFNGYRSELAVYNCANYKSKAFYTFSFYIDSNYSNQAFNLICQWQDLPNFEQGESWESVPILHGSSPPMALVYANETIELRMNDSPSSNGETFLVGNSYPIEKGKWYDVIAHVYWNDDNTAFVNVSINGDYLTPFNGVDNKYYKRNLFNRAGNYFKFGQYRGKAKTSNTNIIYFDEVKIGSNLNELLP